MVICYSSGWGPFPSSISKTHLITGINVNNLRRTPPSDQIKIYNFNFINLPSIWTCFYLKHAKLLYCTFPCQAWDELSNDMPWLSWPTAIDRYPGTPWNTLMTLDRTSRIGNLWSRYGHDVISYREQPTCNYFFHIPEIIHGKWLHAKYTWNVCNVK